MGMTGKVVTGAAIGLLGVFSMTFAPTAHAQRDGVVHCSSIDGKFARCPVPWRDARLVKQESKGSCIRDQSWGMDRGGIWVNRGCRAAFVEEGRGYGDGRRPDRDDRDGNRPDRGYGDGHRQGHGQGGWQPGPNWDRAIRLDCHSNSNRYQMCQVDVGRRGRVSLLRQVSDSRCKEGYSWGWNRAGVWVDHGCRAQFVVDRRW